VFIAMKEDQADSHQQKEKDRFWEGKRARSSLINTTPFAKEETGAPRARPSKREGAALSLIRGEGRENYQSFSSSLTFFHHRGERRASLPSPISEGITVGVVTNREEV